MAERNLSFFLMSFCSFANFPLSKFSLIFCVHTHINEYIAASQRLWVMWDTRYSTVRNYFKFQTFQTCQSNKRKLMSQLGLVFKKITLFLWFGGKQVKMCSQGILILGRVWFGWMVRLEYLLWTTGWGLRMGYFLGPVKNEISLIILKVKMNCMMQYYEFKGNFEVSMGDFIVRML